MIFRRRYRDLIARQLDLFVEEHGNLLAEAREALRVYNEADRDEAEERYGDYADVLDRAAGQLADIRDTYAQTLDDPEAYRAEFERIATKRFPELGDALKEI
jgi:hypothetical protein